MLLIICLLCSSFICSCAVGTQSKDTLKFIDTENHYSILRITGSVCLPFPREINHGSSCLSIPLSYRIGSSFESNNGELSLYKLHQNQFLGSNAELSMEIEGGVVDLLTFVCLKKDPRDVHELMNR